MKIKIVTACDHNQQFLADLNRPILSKYCDIHGYSFRTKDIVNFDRPAAWFKILAIQSEMNDDCDYILWIDTDTLILNLKQKLEDFIQDNKYLYLSEDMNGINSGILLIKNNALMKDFLDKAYELYSIYNEKHPLGGVWEQAAIWHLVAYNYLNIRNYIKLIPASIFNAYDPSTKPEYTSSHVNENTFILHLPNTNNDLRKEILQQYLYTHHKE